MRALQSSSLLQHGQAPPRSLELGLVCRLRLVCLFSRHFRRQLGDAPLQLEGGLYSQLDGHTAFATGVQHLHVSQRDDARSVAKAKRPGRLC
eukprot:COSAG04_NODE_6294_length_1363_cov_1.106804_1_plen_92_part_00